MDSITSPQWLPSHTIYHTSVIVTHLSLPFMLIFQVLIFRQSWQWMLVPYKQPWLWGTWNIDQNIYRFETIVHDFQVLCQRKSWKSSHFAPCRQGWPSFRCAAHWSHEHGDNASRRGNSHLPNLCTRESCNRSMAWPHSPHLCLVVHCFCIINHTGQAKTF